MAGRRAGGRGAGGGGAGGRGAGGGGVEAGVEAGVAPDGSPVEVFRALPPGPAVAYIEAAVDAGVDLLELGCGAGRLTRPLAAGGHHVVAVDVSPEMLACLEGVDGVTTVRGDARTVDLRRRFGAVLLASYLINDIADGAAFLRTAARHVAADGAVVVQRYSPDWARAGDTGTAEVGPVTVGVVRLCPRGDRFEATVEYRLGGRAWAQSFEAAILDDDDVGRMAGAAGLTVDRWLDEHRTWARLVPSG